jgi:hypothetical protein
LPKGPSGKIKLASKTKSTTTKEVDFGLERTYLSLLMWLQNSKPGSKKVATNTTKTVEKTTATTKKAKTQGLAKKPVAKELTKKKSSSAKADIKKVRKCVDDAKFSAKVVIHAYVIGCSKEIGDQTQGAFQVIKRV